jgi:hypothetical protein
LSVPNGSWEDGDETEEAILEWLGSPELSGLWKSRAKVPSRAGTVRVLPIPAH